MNIIETITADLTSLALPAFQKEIRRLTDFVSAGTLGPRRVSLTSNRDLLAAQKAKDKEREKDDDDDD